MKILISLTLLLFMFAAQAQVTELSASVDKNPVLLDESIRLTLEAKGMASRDDADFSVLQNDFRISRPSFSQSTQIINGTMTRTVSWTVSLYPIAAGDFTIPSFELDGQRSEAFEVSVLPIDAVATDQPRDYYVEATVNTQNLYLQQQILYTIKIYLSEDIQRGNLSVPELSGALIEQIGEDSDYQEINKGVRYRIIERNYAIIPQASGSFTIKGPIFEAQVLTNSRQSFANFGRTKTITRRAPDVDITVQSMPDNYSYTWLPSELVEVSEEWQGEADNFVVGEPITRTITLTALGLTKEQLPEINLPYHPSFKVYPEQAKLATVERNNKLIAQGVYNAAIIAGEAGDFVLPEVSIPWFDINSGDTRFAKIPARTVNVVDKGASAPVLEQSDFVEDNVSDDKEPQAIVVSEPPSQGLNLLHYALIMTNIATLIALVILWVGRKNTSTVTGAVRPKGDPANSEEAIFKQLKRELEQGKTQHLSQQLNRWLAQLLKTQHHSVSLSLAKFPETRALEQYNKVLAQQYSDTKVALDYPAIISSLQHFRESVMNSGTNSLYANYYPR